MKATIKNGTLFIEIPVYANPAPSKSGKTLVVATTSGFTTTEAQVAGMNVRIGLNAVIDRVGGAPAGNKDSK